MGLKETEDTHELIAAHGLLQHPGGHQLVGEDVGRHGFGKEEAGGRILFGEIDQEGRQGLPSAVAPGASGAFGCVEMEERRLREKAGGAVVVHLLL